MAIVKKDEGGDPRNMEEFLPHRSQKTSDSESITPKEISQLEIISLLKLIMAKKSINKKAFWATMKNIWRLKGIVDFKEVRNNMFVMEFQDALNL